MLLLSLFTLCLSAGLSYKLTQPNAWIVLIEKPNARSLHTAPISHTGGIAILSSLIISTFILHFLQPDFPLDSLVWLYIATLIISVISFIDDCYTVSALIRLGVHLVAASLLLHFADFSLDSLIFPHYIWHWSHTIGFIFSLLFLVWMTNLYNFMDGMDGLSSGMAVLGFGSFALLGAWHEAWLFASISLLIASASAGFLLFNFPPARLFMGDVGSSVLGFLAAALILWAQKIALFPFWIGVLIFSPFIVDATLTLLRRISQGKRFWQPHKEHYYQALVLRGWSHLRTVLWAYTLIIVCIIVAISALYDFTDWQGFILIASVCFYVILIRILNKKLHR